MARAALIRCHFKNIMNHFETRRENQKKKLLLGGIEPPSTDSKSAIIPLDHRREDIDNLC